jgi:hypothetical protein
MKAKYVVQYNDESILDAIKAHGSTFCETLQDAKSIDYWVEGKRRRVVKITKNKIEPCTGWTKK